MKLVGLLLVLGALGFTANTLLGKNTAPSEGERTTWYANGRIETRVEYVGDKREGAADRWYPDGTKQAEGHYSAGRLSGAWRFYRPDGTLDLERSGTYARGERTAP